jgi:RNA polymerase-binding transcription factor DksA
MELTSGGATARSTSRERGSTVPRTRNEEQWLERLQLNRERLSELRRRLREHPAAEDRPGDGSSAGLLWECDAGDQAQLQHEGAAREAMLRLLSQNSEQIGRALTRLEQGTYGYCEDCDVAIPAERLQIRPEATRCVACQAALDRVR